MFGLLLVLMCAMMGAAVDYLRSQDARAEIQKALDTTVLAIAANHIPADEEHARKYYAAQISSAAIAGNPPKFTFNADGTVAADASMELRTLLLKIIGLKSLPVSVSAKAAAAKAPSGDKAIVAFKALAVKGWFAKDIYAFVRDGSGKIVDQQLVLSHDWDNATQTRTVVPPINLVTKDFTLSGGETFGVMMRVWPDYPGKGSSRNKVAPIDYYSDDPTPSIIQTGDCHSGAQLHEWEDAPNPAKGKNDYKDFVYEMTCKEMPNDKTAATEVRLIQ